MDIEIKQSGSNTKVYSVHSSFPALNSPVENQEYLRQP